ncbi:uncharacterized protein zgc:113229 [Dunckerocampus dactyliophorus]|uniref:uncharacterized protein zgc:113229 n=1 Tax=Dunckerocampus dactyliophorus TaxID=161453 RepID=UPI0024070B96|nr:uncharacterized protein zgc:113229 [Dunckerocampus dactyliophorus]
MSQSSNPLDSQALLQSMLERLKLQHGRERQTGPTWGTGAAGPIQNHQRISDSITNGYEFDVPAERFGVPSVDSNYSHKDGERLQSVGGFQQYRGHFPLPFQKDNISVNMVENTTLPRIFNASSGLPQRPDGGAQWDNINGHKDVTTGQDQGFKGNTYDWSWGSTAFTTDSQENKGFHAGNGLYGSLSKWRDTDIMPNKGGIAMARQKQRSSESKARRWTEKIKERWKERPGSKKGKGEFKDRMDEQSSTLNHLIITSNQDAGESLSWRDSSESPFTQSEDDTIDAFIRSSDDFQFGFSSINLLEEIVSGQEWAKFLKPALSASSANQSPPEETLSSLTTMSNNDGLAAFAPHRSGGLNRQWSFRGSESLPVYNFPAGRNVPESPDSTGHAEVDQSEPMDQGQRLKESGPVQARTSYVERADILEDSLPISRVSRKRQYHSAATSQMGWTQGGQREGVMSSPSSHAMDDVQEDLTTPFLRPNGTLVPPLTSPCAPTPTRGVLRHSAFQNVDSSRESKRRRVEPNRRVHFAEKVEEIPPVQLDPEATDSEEDYGTEAGSVTEEDDYEASEEMKEVPARRPALPAWILALKRKNTGRKRR